MIKRRLISIVFFYIFFIYPTIKIWKQCMFIYYIVCFAAESFSAATPLKRHICCEDNNKNNMPGTGGTCS